MHLLGTLLVAAALAGGGGPASDANVAPCEKAIAGHGSANWRDESLVAGPVGVMPRQPLRQMSQTGNGLVAKMPLLIEGQAPETVTVSVPAGLRNRVFLLYGNVRDRDGDPSTSFRNTRGYGETRLRLCADRPRTIWPGGIRVKGTAPVHLQVQVDGSPGTFVLRLGRPRAYDPS
jgi:hypothetical protein